MNIEVYTVDQKGCNRLKKSIKRKNKGLSLPTEYGVYTLTYTLVELPSWQNEAEFIICPIAKTVTNLNHPEKEWSFYGFMEECCISKIEALEVK